MKLYQIAGAERSGASTSLAGMNTLIPFSLRLLLHLTTSRWDADGDVHFELIRRIEAMRADGWWVRTALPRNYDVAAA